MPTALLSLLLIAVPTVESAAQASNVVWTYGTESSVTHHEVTAFGSLFVSMKDSTVALDGESGSVLWVSQELRNCGRGTRGQWCQVGDEKDSQWVTMRSDLPILIAQREGHVTVFDLETGERLWDTSEVPFDLDDGGSALEIDMGLVRVWSKPDGDTGSRMAALDILSGELAWTIELPFEKQWAKYLARGPRDFFIGKNTDGKKTFVAVDLAAGVVEYESRELGELLEGVAAYDHIATNRSAISNNAREDYDAAFGDTLDIFFTNDEEVVALDPGTGTIRWQVDHDKDLEGWVYDKGRLIISDDDWLTAYRTTDGVVEWRVRAEESGIILVTESGLLVGCNVLAGCRRHARLHDPESGNSLWEWRAEFERGSSRMVRQGETIYAASSEGIQALDLSSWNVRDVAVLEFEGDEVPTRMELIDDGLLLTSSQNAALVQLDGFVVYNRYYKAPGLSTLEKVGRIAAAAALSAASQYAAQAQARQMSAASGGAPVTYSYTQYYPVLGTRFRASSALGRDLYIYTEQPGPDRREGFSLVRLSATDGEETGRAWVEQRKPDFALDPVTGLVFVKRNDNLIEALTFEEGR